MNHNNQAQEIVAGAATSSRRHALAAMLGAFGWLPEALAANEAGKTVRLAISESLVSDVNINDARAAMAIWLKRVAVDLKVVIDFNLKVFDTTEEIVRRARSGQFDVVALDIVEYRQIADTLDPTQIVCETGAAAFEEYLLLVKRNKGIQHLGDLRGRRLLALKGPRMGLATTWLSNVLDEGHFGQAEQFFDSVIVETKASRVVLPLFFGQADAGLTSKRAFEMMCELNPQVGRELITIAGSPPMIPWVFAFRKNYHDLSQTSFAKVYSNLHTSISGRQLSTLFQIGELTVWDIGCLASALSVLDAADRARGRHGAGMRKG